MKASEIRLIDYLKQSDLIQIPIYQRQYSWTQKHCKKLLRDIERVGSNDKYKTHFMGSIVYLQKSSGLVGEPYISEIIDGQQRVTTVILLFLALYKHINNINNPDIEIIKPKMINQNYLIFTDDLGNEHIKLQLQKGDKEVYDALTLDIDNSQYDSSNVKQNFKFFYNFIKNYSGDKNLLYKGVTKLTIVQMKLDADDDAQLIFESLNSTGLKLTEADLVRNFVLMGLKSDIQNRYYNNFWSPIHEAVGEQITDFIRDYLIFKIGKLVSLNDIYEEFKLYANSFSDIEDLLKELLIFAKYYETILKNTNKDKEIKGHIEGINNMGMTTSYPLLLKIFEDFANDVIDKKQVVDAISIIESFTIRRIICSLPAASFPGIFLSVIKAIDEKNYLKSIEKAFVFKTGSARFPNDEEVKAKMVFKDIYNTASGTRKYILNSLEDYNVKNKIDINNYSIEHIMPQKLTTEWITSLGEDSAEDIHSKYLHTIGNLTLVAYNVNSALSNKSFIEKRNMKDGFKDIKLFLNQSIKELNIWNEEEIIKRANYLSEIACSIWKLPIIEKKYGDKLTLNDSWTFTKPSKLLLLGEEFQVSRFIDIYKLVINKLFEIYGDKFSNLIFAQLDTKKGLYSTNSNNLVKSFEPENYKKIYFEVSLSANDIRNSISMFYNILNIQDDLIVYNNDGSDAIQGGELFEKFKQKVVITNKFEFQYNKTIIGILSTNGESKKKIGGVIPKTNGLMFYLSSEVKDYRNLLTQEEYNGWKKVIFIEKEEELDYVLELLLSI